MSKIFTKWQNREISDINCIRGLEQQNKELMDLMLKMDDYLNRNNLNYIGSGSIFNQQMNKLLRKHTWFNGKVSNFKMHDHNLSDKEIDEEYNKIMDNFNGAKCKRYFKPKTTGGNYER